MNARLHKLLSRMPAWTVTIVTVLAILWLTLSPQPIGTINVPIFPGADKIVHGLMFGFLAAVILMDWHYTHPQRPATKLQPIVCATISAALGIAVEFGQRIEALGRSFEWSDMIADCSGAYLTALVIIILQENKNTPA